MIRIFLIKYIFFRKLFHNAAASYHEAIALSDIEPWKNRKSYTKRLPNLFNALSSDTHI